VAVGGGLLLTVLGVRWLWTCDVLTVPMDRLMAAVLAGLLAYGAMGLTDYQLDNVPIFGSLLVYLAIALSTLRDDSARFSTPKPGAAGDAADSTSPLPTSSLPTSSLPTSSLPTSPLTPSPLPPSPLTGGNKLQTWFAKLPLTQLLTTRFRPLFKPPTLALAGLGALLAIVVGLVPLHRAWMLSNQGFLALGRDDINGFAQQLDQATRLAPWEPYYPHQLAWNLSDRGLGTTDPALQLRLIEDGIDWFKQGNQVSPYQEFGHTNLAWLMLNRDPQGASREFARSVQLVPAKRGVLYGLGVSLLMQGKSELATEALSLEAMRDPVFITSPVWQLKELQPLLEPVLNRMEAQYTQGLATAVDPGLWHRLRGGLRWWRGDRAGAQTDWAEFGDPLARMVLALGAQNTPALQAQLAALPDSPGKLAIAAWLDPSQRQNLLRTAWIQAERAEPPSVLLQQLVEAMERSTSLDQWLKRNAPSRSYRRSRDGFGVLSRHIDGPIPVDFLKVMDNLPMTQFFNGVIPRKLDFVPELDQALQPAREALVAKVLKG
jgi:uncharacterized protein involved in response to NO